MLILASTTDKIQVVLSANVVSSQLQCYAVYRDTTTTSISPLNNQIATNNTTAVDLVSSPSASTQRVVEYLSVYNSDTGSVAVTIRFSDNGTLYTLFRCNLAPGSKIEYAYRRGFRVISNAGSIKLVTDNYGTQFISSGLGLNYLGKDIQTSSATALTPKNADGLGFFVNSGKYYNFRFLIFYDVDATTTGTRWNLNVPYWGSYMGFQQLQSLTTSTVTGLGGMNTSTSSPSANATSASTTSNFLLMEGAFLAQSSSFISVSFSPEVASPGSITVKTGSLVTYQEVL
jgi:hypothetical protein